ncbi:sorting nexin-8-like [Rhynchophorus ferrugineus]|uniref:sorting nexin-8-like n=1 Tax=Rhynchophorus ferrugineus TaxID=354439 RepID=UPI003FCD9079
MTTDFSTASIPVLYRDLYSNFSNNGDPIQKEIYQAFLEQCNLESSSLKRIWDLVGPSKESQGVVNRTNFYKTLALVAWAQQGRHISEKLFDTFTGDEYPSPKIPNIAPVISLKQKLFLEEMPSSSNSYQKLTSVDTVNVQLVPEKKGLFLKYSEYIVTSKRFGVNVTRRYNDFVALQELLLNRFPYRLIPNLPPKKIIINDSQFLEERTRGLQRWLTLICRHPVLCHDSLVSFFLTDEASDLQHRIRNIFRKVPDEFMTSDLAATAKDLLPTENGQIATNREIIRSLVNGIGRLKQDIESLVGLNHNTARDIEDISTQLKNISTINIASRQHFVDNWANTQKSFELTSRELHSVSSASLKQADIQQRSVCEKLALVYDILVAHKELCERLEKGLANDHQVALSKMLALKKKKLQGAIRGTNAESIEQLEAKMLAQENIISNIDLRTDFSLYCVHMETQLVFTYLGTIPSIISTFIDLKTKAHFESLDLWRNLQSQYCNEANKKVNGLSQ